MLKYKSFLALCLVAFCVLKANAAGDKKLVLYLPFDEGKGTEVKDLSDYASAFYLQIPQVGML